MRSLNPIAKVKAVRIEMDCSMDDLGVRISTPHIQQSAKKEGGGDRFENEWKKNHLTD